MKNILITGGAGFIGTHLCEELIEKGYKVIVYDNLSPQIHGENSDVPSYIKGKVEFIKGDVRDRKTLKEAVKKADQIVHLASETGVGQSMYEVDRYVDNIIRGTAVLWDILANESHNVTKVVLSSSRAVYGEGKYSCSRCGVIYPTGRTEENLSKGLWDLCCPICGEKLIQCATDEKSQLNPTSIYAIGKKAQEEICMIMGKALNIPTTVVRYQNVYGPRQSLSNPYTGILSIFTTRLRNNQPILVYEDGLESRDFVHVKDVVQGTILTLEKDVANYEIFNIANGIRTTVLEIANILTEYLNPTLKPQITGKYRVGDIRHCYADISKAESLLKYMPKYDVKSGIKDFLKWSITQEAVDLSEKAEKELKEKGMLK